MAGGLEVDVVAEASCLGPVMVVPTKSPPIIMAGAVNLIDPPSAPETYSDWLWVPKGASELRNVV